MSRREDFDNALWSDPDFLALSPEGRMTYIWSWTNPRCGMAGIYKVAPAQAALETGLTVERILAALAELGEADFAYHEQSVVWVRTRVKHLRTRTPQIARSIAKDVEKLSGEHPLRIRFMETYGDYPWLREQLAVLAPSEDGWGLPVTVSPARRREVFERDGNRCVKCGATERLTIDHRKPRSQGGDNSLGNLQALCLGCNARKGPVSDLAQQADSTEPLQDPLGTPSSGASSKRFPGNGTGKGSGQGSSLTSQNHASARQRIFDAWVEATGKTDRTLLDEKRRRLIDKALDAYPEEDVLDAVRGWRHSPHHRGENGQGAVYNDLKLLLRDPANIERFRDYERKPPTPIRPQTKGRATAEDFYAEIGRGA